MSLDGDTALQATEWRAKVLNGTITTEEMREWIKLVRAGRISASQTSARSRERKAPIDTAALLDELDAL